MTARLHHVFAAVSDPGAAAARLQEAGFAPAAPRVHEGQGTDNVCLHLAGGYLELLHARDAAELASDAVAPTGLRERLAWSTTGASPFGLLLAGLEAAPFRTRDYRPPFAGGAFVFPFADEPAALPFVALLPPGLPDRSDSPRHANGASTLERWSLRGPDLAASAALRWMADRGLVALEAGDEPLLTVSLGGASRPGTLDLRPLAPVRLAW